MSVIKVKEYLKEYGLDNKIMEFPVSSATVAQAALAIKCSEGEIAKSISFLVNDEPILVVTAGDQKIDNSKFKSEFNIKAKMIPIEEVEKYIGYNVGGVCPFGVNNNVKVFLDQSLKRFSYIYPACGSSNSAIKLTLEELERTSKYIKWVDVCKKIEK